MTISVSAMFHTCEYLPSLISFCLLRNQSGILYWRGFCIMVITRSTCRYKQKVVANIRRQWNVEWEMSFTFCINQSKREEISNEANDVQDSKQTCLFSCITKVESVFYNFRSIKYHITSSSVSSPARLFISTSAFLHTRLAYLRPTPYKQQW